MLFERGGVDTNLMEMERSRTHSQRFCYLNREAFRLICASVPAVNNGESRWFPSALSCICVCGQEEEGRKSHGEAEGR